MNRLMTDLVRSALKLRRVCSIALCLMFSLAFTVSVRAATICVDQHGKAGCLATITAAVNAAALGDTVQVGPGYYTEDVVIGTQLSLVGSGPERTTIDASGLSNGVYIDGLDNPKLTQVVVSGFTIKNANFEGILVNDATDVTIFHNIVSNNDRSLQLPTPGCVNLPAFETAETANCGAGIHLIGVAHSTVADNIVTKNAGGILVSDETGIGHDDLIARNLVIDNQYAGGITLSSNPADPGLLTKGPAYGIDYIVVSDNDIVHNGFGGGSGGPGVGLYATASGELVSTNTIIGNRLICNFQSGVVVLDNGYIPGSTNNPDVNRNIFAQNYIAGNGADPNATTTMPTGISMVGPTPAVDELVTGNQIEGEGVDVFFYSSATLSLHLNNLGGGKGGVTIIGKGGRVNATENWWGCSSGPGAAGCSSINGSQVTFTPWLTRPANLAFDHHRDFGFGHHFFYDRDHDYNFDHHDCDQDGDHDGDDDHGHW